MNFPLYINIWSVLNESEPVSFIRILILAKIKISFYTLSRLYIQNMLHKKLYFLWKTILIFNLQQNLHTINWYCVCKVTVIIWRYYFESMLFIADDNQFWLASWKNILIVRPLNKWAKYYNNWCFKSSDKIISEKQVKQIKNLVFWLWSAIIHKYSSKNVFSVNNL